MVSKYNSISNTANILLNVFFIIYSIMCIGPLIFVLVISMTDESVLIQNGYSFFPGKLSLEAYRFIFKESGVLVTAYTNTCFVTLIGTVLIVMITAMFAYPLSRKEFKYRKQFSFFLFFTMLFSGGVVPWYLVCVRILNLKNTIFSLFVPYLMSAWYVLIIRTFFSTTIPDSLIDSARIDGAKEFKIFFSIVLPLSTPSLATIGLFSALLFWNDWWLPLMLTTGDRYINLQYMLQRVQQNIEFITQMKEIGGSVVPELAGKIPSESSRMALCILAIGPIIFVYPFLQKYFVQGLTIGAIKG